MQQVILVDVNDNAIGTMDKLEAHQRGLLHRAFSVVVFNSKGEMLLQKRARHKYHSGGLWSNACCSHPQPEELISEAARKRLVDEMGIHAIPVFAYKFIYKASLDNDITENELDYVFICTYDGSPAVNHEEVEDWRVIDIKSLREDMKKNPDQYTAWFKLMMQDSRLTSYGTNKKITNNPSSDG